MTHLFVWHRDRIARPDDPADGMAIESQWSRAGLTLVFKDGPTVPPLGPGGRAGIGQVMVSAVEYWASGAFREALAVKLVEAKVGLADVGRRGSGVVVCSGRITSVTLVATSQSSRARYAIGPGPLANGTARSRTGPIMAAL